MKQENYLKVLDKKKNNEEAQQVNIKSIEEEIKKYLRQQEQERNVEITTNELKNKIIMFVSEHIEDWNLDKDYVNQEGMIDTNKLIGKIFDDILNYGIIQKLVEDPEVTEINSNGRYIFYEIKGRRRPAYDERGARIKFSSPEEQETCITTLIGNNDITFDNRNRLINVKTYEGYRLSATYKTARIQVNKVGEDDYSDFTLRKFKEIPYTLKELCKMHTLTDNMARIMKMTVNNTTHVFCGVVGSGKDFAIDTDIITPAGKVKAKDIKVGDIIFDGAGKPTKVKGIYPQGKKEVYRILFNDNTYIDVSNTHINRVVKYNHEKRNGCKICCNSVDIETHDLIKEFKQGYKFRIETPIIDFNKQDLIIDPYLLGLLLGDGGMADTRQVSFTNSEKDIQTRIKKLVEKEKDELVYKSNAKYHKENEFAIKNTNIKHKLDKLNLMGKKSTEKFIPEKYIYNSLENRLKLIQGLMDTDGSCKLQKHNKNGKVSYNCSYEYSTSSKKLAEQFAFLLRSVGCYVKIKERTPHYTYKGEKKVGQKSYRLYISPPNEIKIVSSEKHLKNWKEQQGIIRKIVSIKKVRQCDTVCFEVVSKEHTFLTNENILTHNTTSHRAELEHIKNNKRVGVVQYPSEINLCKYDKNGNLINDVFQWEAVDSQKQSKAINTQVNLMAHELRNSPEISITNEVRYAEEFWNFLLLTKEGARASTSFHASNSIEAIERMTNEICGHTHQDYKVVLKQVTSGLELIYIQEKLEDGTRKIMQISEVIGCKGDEPIINDIYVFVPNGINKIDKETGEILEIGGTHKMIGTFSDKFKKKLKLKGVSKEEIEQLEKYKVNSEDEETIERYTGEGI